MKSIDWLPSSTATTPKASSPAGKTAGPASRNVSPELFEVLEYSDSWTRKTAGAFDPRAEALTRLWSFCARQDRLPTKDELASARALMSPPAWRLDRGTPHRRTSLRLPDQLERHRQGLHRRPGLANLRCKAKK